VWAESKNQNENRPRRTGGHCASPWNLALERGGHDIKCDVVATALKIRNSSLALHHALDYAVSRHRIHSQDRAALAIMKPATRPEPIRGLRHHPPPHGIIVHAVEFFQAFLLSALAVTPTSKTGLGGTRDGLRQRREWRPSVGRVARSGDRATTSARELFPT